MKFMKQDNFQKNNTNNQNNQNNNSNTNASFQRNPQSDVKIDESGRNSLAGNDDQMIRQKAYELAEKRGFSAGHEMEDWLEAEKSFKKR
jgi:hypothetical protein